MDFARGWCLKTIIIQGFCATLSRRISMLLVDVRENIRGNKLQFFQIFRADIELLFNRDVSLV